MFRDALDQAGDRRDRFTAALERSFDEGMDRVSGWYKRRASYSLLVLAIVLVAILNVDTFTVGAAALEGQGAARGSRGAGSRHDARPALRPAPGTSPTTRRRSGPRRASTRCSS